MSAGKTRLTVTVDPHLVAAGNDAVASNQASSLSAWVNMALAERAARDRRIRALGEAIDGYEATFGLISAGELASQARADRSHASVIRGTGPAPKSRRPRGRGAA